MDWLKVLLLLAVAVATFATEDVPGVLPADDPPLVRCKRPLCDNVCNFDIKMDSNGCPTCECMDDPCQDMICPTHQECIRIPCQTFPCDRLEARCSSREFRPMACPLRECVQDCPFGYKKDLSGCDLCECKDSPCQDVECGAGLRCQPHQPCPTGQQCDFEYQCVPDDGHEMPSLTFCSDVMCLMACEYGFEKDGNGCEICSCSIDPCNNHACPSHEICQAQNEDCVDEDGNCPIYATCVPKPLCHHMRDHPDLLTSMGMSVGSADKEQGHVRCQPDSGEFEYTQCGESTCWCVDDRGVEIPDTRQAKPLTDEPSTCVRNRTQAVDVRFNMTHNLPNLEDHMAQLTEVTITKVTEWLSIEEDYVTGMELISKSVDVVEVHFMLVRGVDDEVDLPTAVFHLHYEIHVQRAMLDYQGNVFTPDPSSVSTKHQYEPMLPAGGGLRPEDSSEEQWPSNSHSYGGSSESDSHDSWEKHGDKEWDDDDSWEKHRDGKKHGDKKQHSWLYSKCFGKKASNGVRVIVLVTSLCLGAMIIIGLACFCKCMKRRRSSKCYDMKKANLAFSNDLYSTMHKVGGEEDKMKLHEDNTTEEKDGSLA